MRRVGKRFVIWMTFKGWLRLGIAALAVLIAGGLFIQKLPSSRTWSYWSLPLSGHTIVIDAGHGGVDGGAVSKQGAIEKDLNLAIALHLRDYLQEAGALVILTREGDYDLAEQHTRTYSKRKTEDLKKRVSLIKDSKPSMVISIHMNSIPSAKWSGAQTFYVPDNHMDNESLAMLIQDEIIRNLANTSRVAAKVKGIYLLDSIEEAPAALVEVGFLSNPGEAARLADTVYQRKVAASIYQGVLRYYSGEQLHGAAQQQEESEQRESIIQRDE